MRVRWLKSDNKYVGFTNGAKYIAHIKPIGNGWWELTLQGEVINRCMGVGYLKKYAKEYIMAKEEGKGDDLIMDAQRPKGYEAYVDRHNRAPHTR